MPRSLEHRAHFDTSADAVHDTLVDRGYLAARLTELGGRDTALVTHDVDGPRATVGLRQGVPVEFLPSVIRRFTGDDLVVDRTEQWRPGDAGGWIGDLEVTVRGLPGSLTATRQLTDSAAGSELVLRGETSMPVPLVGGRIEAIVAERITELLDMEAEFTRRWLAG